MVAFYLSFAASSPLGSSGAAADEAVVPTVALGDDIIRKMTSFLGADVDRARLKTKTDDLTLYGSDHLSICALQYLTFGHRIAFMELFSGQMFIGAGRKGINAIAPLDWRNLYPGHILERTATAWT